MATRAQAAVGSTAWIAAEKENAFQLLEQEKEEIIFPAQHEMEWLNEHMAEIFNKTQFQVTDVFKTPGKLRGKTPRTARKRNVDEARVPLSDIFSSQTQAVASPRQNQFTKQIAQFEIARDAEPDLSSKPPALSKLNTDSGYHGMTEDEMDTDPPTQEFSQEEREEINDQIAKDLEEPTPAITRVSEGRRTTEGSFHSAKEEQTAKLAASLVHHSPSKNISPAKSPVMEVDEPVEEPQPSPSKEAEDDGLEKENLADIEHDFSDIGSPSDGSTPDRPIFRKGSLTFASLPAREPMTTKKSIGNRISQIDQAKLGRTSYVGRMTGGTRLTQAPELDNRMDVDEPANAEKDTHVEEPSAEARATRQHTKSSTQRLHEQIDLLGKTQVPRQSKSIANLATLTAKHTEPNVEPAHSLAQQKPAPAIFVPDDDSWIQPLGSTPPAQRPGLMKNHTTDIMEKIPTRNTVGDLDYHLPAPEQWNQKSPEASPSSSPRKFGHLKSASTITLVSPGKAAMAAMAHTKNISVSNPSHEAVTPFGSPKRMMDGTLSASKSKFQSIMKTAKGLFTSSAGVSAAAKVETLSPSAVRTAAQVMPGLYPNITSMLDDKPLPPSPARRRTRSSMDREKQEKRLALEREKVDGQLEKAREKVRQRAAEFKGVQEHASMVKPNPAQPPRRSPRRAPEEPAAAAGQMAPPPVPNVPSTLKANEPRRPVRPLKDGLQKPKPPPVAIVVGTRSQNAFPSSSTASSSASDAQSTAKPGTLTKKDSSASLNTISSSNSLKSSTNSQGKVRALVLAEQKREQEEREAQRKAEQKRETERKRAAQRDEARRQEQKQRAEAERVARERAAAEEARRNAQKQPLEKRRLEAARKIEQQRSQNAATEQVAQMNKAEAMPPRPASRMAAAPMPRSLVNHPKPNPAKPPKRPVEDEPTSNRPQAPKFGGASQQMDSKRRRTGEIEAPPVRPTMAPPIRQSNVKPKASIMPHGYTHAPAPPPVNQATSQLYGGGQASSSTYNPQPYHGQANRPVHPTELARYTNQKLVFADAPNPPSHHTQHQNAYKTPTANHHYSAQHQRSVNMVKSSPGFTNGDNISLPEIPTDDEDSDSDASPSFDVPSWASPNHLIETLMEQDANGLDPDLVFGPMAPLRMEEIFAKGTHKDRLKKLRDRTSSARWVENGDVLTQEEVEKDRVARQRIRGEGGWRMGIS